MIHHSNSRLNQRGEGAFLNILLLLVLGGLGYGVYYFLNNKSSSAAPAASNPSAIQRTDKDARPGSPAGAAAKQAQEMGSVQAQ